MVAINKLLPDGGFSTMGFSCRMFDADVEITNWITPESSISLEISATTLCSKNKLFSFIFKFSKEDIEELTSGYGSIQTILRDGLRNQVDLFPSTWLETKMLVKVINRFDDQPEFWDDVGKEVLRDLSFSSNALNRIH